MYIFTYIYIYICVVSCAVYMFYLFDMSHGCLCYVFKNGKYVFV